MLKLIWNRLRSLRCICVFLLSVTFSHAANNGKLLNHEITHEKKSWTQKMPTRKKFEPTKYPRERLDHATLKHLNYATTTMTVSQIEKLD